MAYEGVCTDMSWLAAEDLSDYQYHFVHLANDTTVDLLDSGDEYPIGILQNAPESGEMAVVRLEGISKLVVNGAIAVGGQLTAEYVGAADNGKGAAAVSDYDNIRAIALTAAGAEDDVVTVLLCQDTQAIANTPSASVSASPSASVSASPSASPSASVSASPST